MNWDGLASRVLEGDVPKREEAQAILKSGPDELLPLLHAAFRVRKRFFGRDVSLHVLRNAKSGVCPEDCGFCSQALTAESGVERYGMQSVAELVEGARQAHSMGAARYCMVTATRGPSSRELEAVCKAVRQIKAELPLEICTSLGFVDAAQAKTLAEAGVDRFNHNLETSRGHFPSVVSTHGYDDRVATIRAVKEAGMEACCGGIMGMGETLDDRIDLAFELRELEVESIPVNFLDPRPGTPMAGLERPSPGDCLRILCLFRFVNPSRDIRVAGGREVNLRHVQPLALYPANSIFTQGYLTTGGQDYESDLAMIRDAGFELVEEIAA